MRMALIPTRFSQNALLLIRSCGILASAHAPPPDKGNFDMFAEHSRPRGNRSCRVNLAIRRSAVHSLGVCSTLHLGPIDTRAGPCCIFLVLVDTRASGDTTCAEGIWDHHHVHLRRSLYVRFPASFPTSLTMTWSTVLTTASSSFVPTSWTDLPRE